MISLETILVGAKKIWPAQLMKKGMIDIRLIVLGMIGILLLLSGGIFDNLVAKPKIEMPSETVKSPLSVSTSYEEALERKLAMILAKVKGAGEVDITITLEQSSMQEHAKNIMKENKVIQEKDASGGIRTTTETKESEQILLGKENGVDRPVIVREVKPIIKGVLVIAEGASDSIVKANLTKAIEAALGVPPYKITVLAQRK